MEIHNSEKEVCPSNVTANTDRKRLAAPIFNLHDKSDMHTSIYFQAFIIQSQIKGSLVKYVPHLHLDAKHNCVEACSEESSDR